MVYLQIIILNIFKLNIKLTEYGMNNLEEVRKFMQDNPIEMAIFFLILELIIKIEIILYLHILIILLKD